jgi:peptidoglycan hydrolase-like amidase
MVVFGSAVMAFSPNIPFNTLKAAEESRLPDIPVSKPVTANIQSEIVRVGIGNQSFGSYVYKTIGVYATAPLNIYSDGLMLKQVPANTNVNVTITSDNSYNLTLDNGDLLGNLNGIVKFTTQGGCLGIKNLKRAGKPALYHGYFEIMKSPSGNQFNLVNKLPVEWYLRGVVPNEMPINFGL